MSYFKEKEFFRNVFCKLSIIMVALLCLIACSSESNVSNINKRIGESNDYTEEEIKGAMDVVVEQFKSTDYNGCTLTDLWYDEDAVAKQQAELAKKYNVEEVIVILSNFKTGSLSYDNPLTSYTTYNDYRWILVKNENHWEMRDRGY